MFGFVRFGAKAFMRSGKTRPPNIAGTPSSLGSRLPSSLAAAGLGSVFVVSASIVMLQHLKMDPSERAVCDDLSRLKAEDQHAYYLETCEDLGLDPATFPLRWIVVDGRLVLAVETCTLR